MDAFIRSLHVERIEPSAMLGLVLVIALLMQLLTLVLVFRDVYVFVDLMPLDGSSS